MTCFPDRCFTMRVGAWALGALALLTLSGCGTTTLANKDPYEVTNRQIFDFNDRVDVKVVQPVARGYAALVPEPVRTGVRNVFNNIGDVWSAANSFMQGNMADGTQGVVRVTLNTTFGLGGLLDVATALQVERHKEDFGQTLGVWGFKSGPYVVLPLLGPSTVRDTIGVPADFYFSPSALASSSAGAYSLTGLRLISVRAEYLDATDLLGDVALDRYAFVRDAYLQRRQSLIYEGNPPDEELEDPRQAPDAPSSPAR